MVKEFVRNALSEPVYLFLSSLKNWRLSRNRDELLAYVSFMGDRCLQLSLKEKLEVISQLYVITFNVSSPHTHAEILNYFRAILSLPKRLDGVMVEAGCYKGGSTAKFSLAADIAGRDLVVFDSFQGIPPNDQPVHKDIFGRTVNFPQGDYCGTLDEVCANVATYGKINRCRFIPGWFDDTMPHFKEPIAAIYLDVDLASSIRTCLKYLYPLLQPGGVLFSQDGHIPLVIDVFDNNGFWLREVGCKKPPIEGLYKRKLIKIVKS